MDQLSIIRRGLKTFTEFCTSQHPPWGCTLPCTPPLAAYLVPARGTLVGVVKPLARVAEHSQRFDDARAAAACMQLGQQVQLDALPPDGLLVCKSGREQKDGSRTCWAGGQWRTGLLTEAELRRSLCHSIMLPYRRRSHQLASLTCHLQLPRRLRQGETAAARVAADVLDGHIVAGCDDARVHFWMLAPGGKVDLGLQYDVGWVSCGGFLGCTITPCSVLGGMLNGAVASLNCRRLASACVPVRPAPIQ